MALALVYALAVSAFHLARPVIDVKMSNVYTNQIGNELVIETFTLRNSAYINLKDPVIACDMKGASGTTIKTTTKTLYEPLPSGQARVFEQVAMGSVPDQVTEFKCYLKSVRVKW
jgi:hypothetical protein